MRIKRAKSKKKYQERQVKRAENKEKAKGKLMYKKKLDASTTKLSGKKRKCINNTNDTNTTKPPNKVSKYSCNKCGKGYKNKGHYFDNHVKNCKGNKRSNADCL